MMRSLTDHPVRVGWIVTAVIVGLAIWLGFTKPLGCVGDDCQARFAVLLASKPNEVGDALAGFSGALAFVWIIVTVWLQSKELAAQREELVLTREEMAEQRKATQDMARSMASQAQIFEDEKRQRIEVRAAGEMREKAQTVFELTEIYGDIWWLSVGKEGGQPKIQYITLFQDYFNQDKSDPYRDFISMENEIEHSILYVQQNSDKIRERPSREAFPEVMLRKLEELNDLYPTLSEADKEKFSRACIDKLLKSLKRAKEAKIWAEDFE